MSQDEVGWARGWFGTVEVAEAPEAAVEVLREVVRLLDDLQPRLVDTAASTAVAVPGRVSAALEIHLVHRHDQDAEVDVFVSEDAALVTWLTADEHIRLQDADAGRAWPTVVAEVIAAVLRGEHEVEETYRGRWWVKTRIVDLAHPGAERVIGGTGSRVTSWLPGLGRRRLQRRRLDYAVPDR